MAAGRRCSLGHTDLRSYCPQHAGQEMGVKALLDHRLD
jgi:hypothetical protein